MSIRLRLARWYGLFLTVILVAFGGLSYGWHTHGHYDDLDRVLLTTAGHHAAEAARTPTDLHLTENEAGFDIALRLYDAHGTLLEASPHASQLPPLDPRTILAQPSGPAYGALAGLIPALHQDPLPTGSAFGIMDTAAGRWRVLVVPIKEGDRAIASLAVFAPLDRLDHAMRQFQFMLLGLGSISILLVSLGSWVLARKVLQPIATMIDTASVIARSRDFSRRITTGRVNDELHHLGETFNEMLASLEIAYRSQQRFVADASHELRAPLTAIQGNLELLRHQHHLSESDREDSIMEAEREAQRLSRLVADLLALARADAGVRVQAIPVELDSLVLEVFRSVRQRANKHTLVLEPFEPISTRGDADRLKQLVVILIDNALKYTPVDGEIRVGLTQSPVGAVITVVDTGIGIEAADLAQVFERFYRADPARARDPGGSGLGLPIARWITEQHGGTITIQSQPHHGTTVTVVLPSSP